MEGSNVSIERLREKAVERFYPEESDLKEMRDLYEEISGFINKEGFETFFAGSAGRETCMKGDKDIDIFIMFSEDIERKKLENKGLEIGRKVFDEFDGSYKVEYAEHPYTKGVIQGHEVEVVPCYDTEPENIQSAVDRSPHHAKWVRKHLSETQRQDVVVLKAFLRSAGIYGSSLKTRGFSGYLCELLIYSEGSFENLIEESVSFEEDKVKDPANHHRDELPEELEKKFEKSSLVVVDPVDPQRNVASVLTKENYARFVYQAWKFNNNPGFNFFVSENPEPNLFRLKKELQSRADFIVLEFDAPDKPEDIIYPQMRKSMKRLLASLEDHNFNIYESGFHVDDSIRILFELDEQIPEISYRKGPSVFHGTDHIEQFTSKYDNTFIQEDRLYAKTEREYKHARKLLKDFLDSEPSKLEQKGLPGNIASKISSFRMIDILQEDEEWLKFLFNKLKIVEQ